MFGKKVAGFFGKYELVDYDQETLYYQSGYPR